MSPDSPEPPQGGGRAGFERCPRRAHRVPDASPGTRAGFGRDYFLPAAPAGKARAARGRCWLGASAGATFSPAVSAAVRALAAALKLPEPADFAAPGSGAGPAPTAVHHHQPSAVPVVPASRQPPTSGGSPVPVRAAFTPVIGVRQPLPAANQRESRPRPVLACLRPLGSAGQVKTRRGRGVPAARGDPRYREQLLAPCVGTQSPGTTPRPASPAAAPGGDRGAQGRRRRRRHRTRIQRPAVLPDSGRSHGRSHCESAWRWEWGPAIGRRCVLAGLRFVESMRQEAAGAASGARARKSASNTLAIEYYADRNALRDSLLVGDRLWPWAARETCWSRSRKLQPARRTAGATELRLHRPRRRREHPCRPFQRGGSCGSGWPIFR